MSKALSALPVNVGAHPYLSYIENLIPSTIFSPFLENQVMSVLFLGIIIGSAIRMIPDDDARYTITHFLISMGCFFLSASLLAVTKIRS